MHIKKIFTPLLLLTISSCASIVSPTGGPKDETPPVCTKKVPSDNTIHFTETGVDFYFDEYVVLADISNQFIISPPMDKDPDIKVKGHKVSVIFKENLKPNTTYTLNFGNGIVDNNEANILQGLSYTFSTGAYIDSLTLSGNIMDGFTKLPAKDIAVGLYEITEDSTIFKNKPYYLVKPDSAGNFSFKYLRPSEYELVAFEDINRNLKIETNERIAFHKSKIILSYEAVDSSIYQLLLSPQPIKNKPQIITAKELAKGKYEITATATNCILKVLEEGFAKKQNFITSIKGENCDTLYIYTDDECKDSIKYQIQVDTLVENVIINCNSKQYEKFNVKSHLSVTNFDFSKPVELSFTNPIFEIRTADIKLFEDSMEISNYSIVKDSASPLLLKIEHAWKPEKPYTLVVTKGALKDIYGQDIDSLKLTIKTAPETAFGNLSINITDKDSTQLIVQLLDNQSAVVQQHIVTNSKSIQYKNLIPGHYFVKVIYDENKNNRWDGGNYFTKQQPEKVFVTKQSLEVRANWDLTDIEITPGL